MIDVVIIDDHPVMRWGVRATLEESGLVRIVGEAADGAEAVETVRRCRPDVVVMDLNMSHVDGAAATRAILERVGAPVVVLTAETRQDRLVAAHQAGASAVVSKGDRASVLLEAVRRAAGSRGSKTAAPQGSPKAGAPPSRDGDGCGSGGPGTPR